MKLSREICQITTTDITLENAISIHPVGSLMISKIKALVYNDSQHLQLRDFASTNNC